MRAHKSGSLVDSKEEGGLHLVVSYQKWWGYSKEPFMGVLSLFGVLPSKILVTRINIINLTWQMSGPKAQRVASPESHGRSVLWIQTPTPQWSPKVLTNLKPRFQAVCSLWRLIMQFPKGQHEWSVSMCLHDLQSYKTPWEERYFLVYNTNGLHAWGACIWKYLSAFQILFQVPLEVGNLKSENSSVLFILQSEKQGWWET